MAVRVFDLTESPAAPRTLQVVASPALDRRERRRQKHRSQALCVLGLTLPALAALIATVVVR
jgi:hypothetical protein